MAQDLFRLDGKTVLVTGASSGLGRHFALLMAQAGASVALAARRIDVLEDLVQEINSASPKSSDAKAKAFQLDVSNAQQVSQCFDQVAAWHLPDVIINNAGVTITKPLLQQSESDWDQVIDTNLKGAWLVATEAARRLVAANKPGNIVNISSILGERVAGGVAPYAISKAGVLQLTKTMALELARYSIRVNALLPGYITTDLNRTFLQSEAGEKLRARIPSRRFGEVSDLDGPILLLASDASQAMSGTSIAVDGAHLVNTL